MCIIGAQIQCVSIDLTMCFLGKPCLFVILWKQMLPIATCTEIRTISIGLITVVLESFYRRIHIAT